MILLWLALTAQAHDFRTHRVEITEVGAGFYAVTGGAALDWPAACALGPGRLRCEGSLSGHVVRLRSGPQAPHSAVIRFEGADGHHEDAVVTELAPDWVAGAADYRQYGVGLRYLALGVDHILEGIDHLAFVTGLVVLVFGSGAEGAFKRLAATITAFTAAHSVTLTLATLGWVSLPSAPVEACIALSIVLLAREAALIGQGPPKITARSPWIVAFGFGLLHGFGFAGALSEVGLPPGDLFVALLAFNLGVELGQLLFVGALVGFAASAARLIGDPLRDPRALRLVALGLGGLSAGWLIDRLTWLIPSGKT